jgi:hypothetical protein
MRHCHGEGLEGKIDRKTFRLIFFLLIIACSCDLALLVVDYVGYPTSHS